MMIAQLHDASMTLTPQAWRLVRRTARRLVGRAGFRPVDREDLEQELALRLWQGLRNFDPAAGSPGGFAATVLARAAHSLLRRRNCRKRGKGHNHCSLTMDYEGTEDRAAGDVAELAICSADRPHEVAFDLVHDVAVVLAQLPPQLRELAEQLKHHNVSQIAREAGVSRSTIYGRIAALRAAFREAEQKNASVRSDTLDALCEVYR